MKPRIAAISAIAIAALMGAAAPAVAHSIDEKPASESIWLGLFSPRLSDWRAVSRTELIIWASPGRPYLVTTRYPHSRLRHAHTIGVTSSAGRITKFESIIVDGWRVPIESIVALDRDTARAMRWSDGG